MDFFAFCLKNDLTFFLMFYLKALSKCLHFLPFLLKNAVSIVVYRSSISQKRSATWKMNTVLNWGDIYVLCEIFQREKLRYQTYPLWMLVDGVIWRAISVCLLISTHGSLAASRKAWISFQAADKSGFILRERCLSGSISLICGMHCKYF